MLYLLYSKMLYLLYSKMLYLLYSKNIAKVASIASLCQAICYILFIGCSWGCYATTPTTSTKQQAQGYIALQSHDSSYCNIPRIYC